MVQRTEHLPLTNVAGFDSRTGHHMWVEFVGGSPLRSERFFSGYSGFLLPQKPTFPNSNLTWTQWMRSYLRDVPLLIPIYLITKIKTTGVSKLNDSPGSLHVSKVLYSTLLLSRCRNGDLLLKKWTKIMGDLLMELHLMQGQ